MSHNFSNNILWIFLSIFIIFFLGYTFTSKSFNKKSSGGGKMKLPQPETKGKISVEKAISERKSIRNFKNSPISLTQLSQIAWVAAGKKVDAVTTATRTYPSAGGIYPINLYIVVSRVKDLEKGIYKYFPEAHEVKLIKKGSFNNLLSQAALGQYSVKSASVNLVFTANYSKTARRYGKRGEVRYVHMDLGHAAENVYLQVEALGLGTVSVGAFNDEKVEEVMGLKDSAQSPIYIMPVGKPK